jgi:hypothetical protein
MPYSVYDFLPKEDQAAIDVAKPALRQRRTAPTLQRPEPTSSYMDHLAQYALAGATLGGIAGDPAVAQTFLQPTTQTPTRTTSTNVGTTTGGVGATHVDPGPAGVVDAGGEGPETLQDILNELGLTGISEAQLTAALEALAAEYGVGLAELLGQRDLLIDEFGNPGPLIQQALTTLQRQYEGSRRNAISDVLRRGVFRSGIAAENIGRMEQEFAERRAGVFQKQGGQLSSIQSQMDALRRKLGADEAKARADIDMQNLQVALQARLGGI